MVFELSDLVVGFGPDGARVPVARAALVEQLERAGDRAAARVARRLPVDGAGMVRADELLIAAHCEIQRLSEEFRHGDRMAELLDPLLGALRASGVAPPYRVVDMGCGTGYMVRYLAAARRLPDAALVGVDMNPALVAEARRLADAEGIDATFECGDAFELEAAHVVISTGVLHHFPRDSLGALFAAHERAGVLAFAHVDYQPNVLAPIGAWMFHRTRMRIPLARLDGVRSARRAYSVRELAAAAGRATPSFSIGVYGCRLRTVPLPRPLATVVRIRRDVVEAFVARLGPRRWRWEPVG